MTKRAAASADPSAGVGGDAASVNEVRLAGRLAAAPVTRELPSGDVLVQFRLVVDRPPARGESGRRTPSIDTIDCAAWRKDVQRMLRACEKGDVVEVDGSLRRRFWRAASGPASRSEVEVSRLRRARRNRR